MVSILEIKEYKSINNLNEDDASGIANFIWWNDTNLDEESKLDLTLALFQIKPSYGVLMELSMNFEKLNNSQRDRIWKDYKAYLSKGNKNQKEAVEYSLWVDFFENNETVEEAWKSMIGNYENEVILKRLLPISGPVPFDLKEEFYKRVVKDEKWHEYILDSLVGSFFDVFGQINIEKARLILSRLKVNKDSNKYSKLQEYIRKYNSKEEYWEDINNRRQ